MQIKEDELLGEEYSRMPKNISPLGIIYLNMVRPYPYSHKLTHSYYKGHKCDYLFKQANKKERKLETIDSNTRIYTRIKDEVENIRRGAQQLWRKEIKYAIDTYGLTD